jgi:phosphinothricin acetyltransferase
MRLRIATIDDLEAITRIYNHYVVNTHVTFDLEPVSLENRKSWFTAFNKDPLHRLLVGETDEGIIGYASSSRFRVKPAYESSVETTIYLDPESTGLGYGRALYEHLLQALTGTAVHRCYGVIALPNEASVSLHKKLGFREAGRFTEVGYKFDQFWDTLWMERSM